MVGVFTNHYLPEKNFKPPIHLLGDSIYETAEAKYFQPVSEYNLPEGIYRPSKAKNPPKYDIEAGGDSIYELGDAIMAVGDAIYLLGDAIYFLFWGSSFRYFVFCNKEMNKHKLPTIFAY